MPDASVVGALIQFRGIVQGVGFRPFIYRTARSYGLTGSVKNTENGVSIQVDGTKEDIESFYRIVQSRPPVLAEIHESSLVLTDPSGFKTFTIAESTRAEYTRAEITREEDRFTPISPDIAVCDECLREVFQEGNRRFLYPFTNCTDCGPRFTIIASIPYDRPNTTMRTFQMCGECLAEYRNPLDRRYHAQPNACPACGPEIQFEYAGGARSEVEAGNKPGRRGYIQRDAIKAAAELIRAGKILAVKGLGGYHLAVDPFNGGAVERLRMRKRRPGKPFALMARDLAAAKKYCRIGPGEGKLLLSFERPILLLERAEEAGRISAHVAPDTRLLGIFLPYTPLHHILMTACPELLVMTSANFTEEPLVYRDDDAVASLSSIADGFLTHNREIRRPCDDSVLLKAGVLTFPIRRSRGYVPRAIELGLNGSHVFSAGASEKNTFCVCRDGKAYLSHHIGDLDNEKSVEAYLAGVDDFLSMFRIRPEAVACDLHPDYVSTRLAEERAEEWGVPLIRVQHHHAHIAALLGEKRHGGKVIGVAFDGTGYGTDGTVWGGEFLVADQGTFERAGHFSCVPMPGGEASIRETDRMGLAYLISAFGTLAAVPPLKMLKKMGGEKAALIEKMIKAGINSPLTSSCGRLFDAVSAILGLCSRPAYDAQGAILLENASAAAAGVSKAGVATAGTGMEEMSRPYSFFIDDSGDCPAVHFEPMIREIAADVIGGVALSQIASRFHSTIVASGVEMCMRIKNKTGLKTVALSGGSFQNRILAVHFQKQLADRGFDVLSHSLVPPNDGGISLGQAVAALRLLEGGSV